MMDDTGHLDAEEDFEWEAVDASVAEPQSFDDTMEESIGDTSAALLQSLASSVLATATTNGYLEIDVASDGLTSSKYFSGKVSDGDDDDDDEHKKKEVSVSLAEQRKLAAHRTRIKNWFISNFYKVYVQLDILAFVRSYKTILQQHHLFKGFVWSVIPKSLHSLLSGRNKKADVHRESLVRSLTSWWSSYFDRSMFHSISPVFLEELATFHLDQDYVFVYCLGFIYLAEYFGLEVRLVKFLKTPKSLFPHANEDEKKNTKTKKEVVTDDDDDDEEKVEKVPRKKKSRRAPEMAKEEKEFLNSHPSYIVEVKFGRDDEMSSVWKTVDIFMFRGGLIDDARVFDNPADSLYFSISFILLSDGNSKPFDVAVSDVSKRYCKCIAERNSRAQKYFSFFENFLGIINAKLLLRHSRLKAILEDEKKQLNDLELSEITPTNINHYKNHPMYALERFLRRTQVIYPKETDEPHNKDDIIVGYVKGDEEPIYKRSSVRTLKSQEAWFQRGYVLKASTIPAKWVKDNRKNKKEFEAIGQEEHEGMMPLYGAWQLERYKPPSIEIEGIVPKNEFNNVYYFHPWMLPKGTIHMSEDNPAIQALRSSGLEKVLGQGRKKYEIDELTRSTMSLKVVAKKLNIDYADAVVGFEFSGGRARPRMDGIVICKSKKLELIQGFNAVFMEKLKKKLEEKQVKLKRAWKLIVTKAAVLYDFDRKYKNQRG